MRSMLCRISSPPLHVGRIGPALAPRRFAPLPGGERGGGLKPAATSSVACRPRIENARGLGVSSSGGGEMHRLPRAAVILTTALLTLACGSVATFPPPFPRSAPRSDWQSSPVVTSGEYDAVPWQPPDGRRIAFSAATGGPTSDIYVVDTVGGEVRQLTDGPSQAIFPSWWPDGRYGYHVGASRGPPLGG